MKLWSGYSNADSEESKTECKCYREILNPDLQTERSIWLIYRQQKVMLVCTMFSANIRKNIHVQ